MSVEEAKGLIEVTGERKLPGENFIKIRPLAWIKGSGQFSAGVIGDLRSVFFPLSGYPSISLSSP